MRYPKYLLAFAFYPIAARSAALRIARLVSTRVRSRLYSTLPRRSAEVALQITVGLVAGPRGRTAGAATRRPPLVVSDPANMNYLTGYDGWSFYVHQCVVVTEDLAQPIWIGRGQDGAAGKRCRGCRCRDGRNHVDTGRRTRGVEHRRDTDRHQRAAVRERVQLPRR